MVMKIYSIKEIVKATNSFLKPETKILQKKNNKIKNIKLPPKTESIIAQAEKTILERKKNYQDKKKPLLLNNEASKVSSANIDSFNNNIEIKLEVKNYMINELYIYLKKKVRKNTLQLIIDEQLEIKNLKKQVDILKQTENHLRNNYEKIKNDHELVLLKNKNLEINKVQLSSEIKELKISNEVLQNNLNHVTENKILLDDEIVKLKSNNNTLHNNLNQINENKKQQEIENKELKVSLDKTKNDLNENIERNQSNEIHNLELKNTVSRYIVNTKKIQEKLDLSEQSNNLKLDTQNEKVKFYQEENVRLSSELLIAKKKNTAIKENLNFIENEKDKISNKIKELNKSIDEKTNIIPSNFVKENLVQTEEKTNSLNDKEQKSLDEVINRIFAKI